MKETVVISQEQLNYWRKVLYNNEELHPRVYFVPAEFPKKPVPLSPVSVPPKLPRTEIYFDRTRTGWRCSHKLKVILNEPCPLLPEDMQFDIRHGYHSIEKLMQQKQDVLRARYELQIALFNYVHRKPRHPLDR